LSLRITRNAWNVHDNGEMPAPDTDAAVRTEGLQHVPMAALT